MEQLARVRSHRELIVWQKAMDLVVAVYGLSHNFPKSELYGLTSQLTRAAVSVPGNIAEGYNRDTTREYCRYLSTAKGLLMEVETYLFLAIRLDYAPESEVEPLLELVIEVSKMLTTIRKKLVATLDT